VNVYPAEIERALTDLPGLRQCVAFGLPDERWGERVCIAVTGDIPEADISEFVASQLSGPKRSKSIFLLDALPLTHSGKINRTIVPALFERDDAEQRPSFTRRQGATTYSSSAKQPQQY
jgi:long-chain acyl-CoA synthetase